MRVAADVAECVTGAQSAPRARVDTGDVGDLTADAVLTVEVRSLLEKGW